MLRGEEKIHDDDVRARIVFIHTTGDPDDPANYRPIAVLNTEYKIMTATLAAIVRENLSEWMILKQQLARQDVWGTVHGLLWDKACTQSARSKNYSA